MSVIAHVIGRHEASLAYAYESTVKAQPSYPNVKVVIGFDIMAEGDVENAEIISLEGFDTLPEAAALSAMFVAKVNEAAYTWKFPPITAGTVPVEMPFLFLPADEGVEETTYQEKAHDSMSNDYGKIVEKEGKEVYIFKERKIEYKWEKPVLVEIPGYIPVAGVLTNAAKGETEKPTRGFLEDAGSYFNEWREPAAEGLGKKAARRERELGEAEAALALEELRVAVADLGFAEGYDWGVKKPDVKKAAKLRDKQGRLTAEIESLHEEINAVEETRAQSLADERAVLIARGEELLGEAPTPSTNPWLPLALADLYLDAGEGAKAAPLFERVIETGGQTAVTEALYGLAHAYDAAGDEEKASRSFLSVATEYPDSAYQGEVCFRLGEYFTSQREAEKAEEYYLLAAEADAQYRGAALYRAAWSYYECSNPFGTLYYDRAVPAFERFLEGADESSPYWGHAIEMAGVCLAEWEPGAAEKPAPVDALSRYEEVFDGAKGRAYAADVLRALGDAYLYRMDRLPEAAATYEYLLGEYPLYGDAAGVIRSIVESDLNRGAYDEAHAARLRLVDEYGPASGWYRAQDEPTRCRALLDWENALYEVGVYFNMRAERKLRTNPDEALALYRSAIDRYNQYLTSFPTNEKAYHINFYLAECYFAIEDFKTSAHQYIKTATHYTDRERYKIDKWDEKFTQEQSFFNAVVAYDEIYQKEIEERTEAGAPTAQRISPRPLTEAEFNLIETCKEYLARYPESKERPSIFLKMGEVYTRAGDFDTARRSYSEIIEKYADPDDKPFDSEKLHGMFYVGVLISMARTFQIEADVLSEAGETGAAAKRAEYEAWLGRARAEAEKRKLDFEEIMEDLE